jgi:hypothetical protein
MNWRRLAARVVAAGVAMAASFVLKHDMGGSGLVLEGMISRPAPARPWTVVGGKHWQLAAHTDAVLEPNEPAPSDDVVSHRGACAEGMLEVSGRMRLDGPGGTVEDLQDRTCVDWISREFPARCAAFDPASWQHLSATLPTLPMHFCIDAYEYPNRKGDYPIIGFTWYEAVSACEERGARLCSEDEWTFACEGEDALPYPYGYRRRADACVIDRAWRQYDDGALAQRDSPTAIREVDYLWQGEPSGSREDCRSPFGAHDMTGNVDEWTRSVQREGYRSIFKGGYWGPVRARCRASTRVHNEDFYFYQQGFRCCANASSSDAGEPAP